MEVGIEFRVAGEL